MTVCWYKETVIDSIVKTILLNVINLCCFNLILYQYHHSYCDHSFNQFYLILIFNIVNCKLYLMYWKQAATQSSFVEE